MVLPATQLRAGMIIEYNNDLWRVMTITHITPGNWRGMVQTKLRNIKTGSQTENRFRSEDRVERVILEPDQMQFLYQDGDDYHFMNTENYEQIPLDATLGDSVKYLIPNLEVQVEFYETTPLNVTLPKYGRPQGGADRPGDEERHGHQHAEAGDDRDRRCRARPGLRRHRRHHPRRYRIWGVPVAGKVGPGGLWACGLVGPCPQAPRPPGPHALTPPLRFCYRRVQHSP